LNTELVLDVGWYERIPSKDTPRKYELVNYPINGRKPSPVEVFWCRLHQGPLLRRIPFLPRKWRHVREKYFGFDPEILMLPDNVYLDGYWQCPKYFEDISLIIREELAPLLPFGAEDERINSRIGEGGAVSVHVRRGDYVTNPAAARTHGLCSIDYYKAALDHICQRVSRPRFFVFSDDPKWVRENLPMPTPCFFVDHNGPEFAFQDLCLMARCDHHIMANSSFSWWGGWLNSREGKIVVMPKRWFSESLESGDMALQGWVRL